MVADGHASFGELRVQHVASMRLVSIAIVDEEFGYVCLPREVTMTIRDALSDRTSPLTILVDTVPRLRLISTGVPRTPAHLQAVVFRGQGKVIVPDKVSTAGLRVQGVYGTFPLSFSISGLHLESIRSDHCLVIGAKQSNLVLDDSFDCSGIRTNLVLFNESSYFLIAGHSHVVERDRCGCTWRQFLLSTPARLSDPVVRIVGILAPALLLVG